MFFENESYHKSNKKIPLIQSAENNSIFSNTIKEAVNEEKKKLFINTDNIIFKDKTFTKRKTVVKIYNLKNYKNIINKHNSFNSSSFEEQNENNIINSFFDSLKLRTIKKEFLKNNTNLCFKNKGIITENKISHKNFNNINYFNNTDLSRTKRMEIYDLPKRKNFSIPKKELSYNSDIYNNSKVKSLKDLSNSLENKKINQKIKKNKTIVLPDIKEIKSNLKNLFFKVEELDKDLKKQKINYIDDIPDEKKNNNNIKMKIIRDKKNIILKLDEEKNQNILKNKQYLSKYIKQFDNFKYKNKAVNSFFKEKQKQKNQNDNFLLLEDENEEEKLRKNQKDALIHIKIMDQLKELKNKVKSNIDKDIFKVFNKKI